MLKDGRYEPVIMAVQFCPLIGVRYILVLLAVCFISLSLSDLLLDDYASMCFKEPLLKKIYVCLQSADLRGEPMAGVMNL